MGVRALTRELIALFFVPNTKGPRSVEGADPMGAEDPFALKHTILITNSVHRNSRLYFRGRKACTFSNTLGERCF